MKVLIITPTPTYPADQGNRVRVNQIGSFIQNAGGQTDLLYYDLDGISSSAIHVMKETWGQVFIVRTENYIFRKKFAEAWGVDDWVSASLINALRHLSQRTKYDIVIVNYVWLSACLDVFDSDVLKIIDTHDAFGGRHQTSRAHGMTPNWFYTTVEEEAKGLDRADFVVAIQEAEGKYFSTITKSKVVALEYAPTPCVLPPRKTSEITIGYIGSGNPWNVRSIEEFDKHLRLVFGSNNPPSAFRFLLFGGITKASPRVELFKPVGPVDAVLDFYLNCDLSVNPMIAGTGLKIKTVEALSFGCPIITTDSGADGLSCLPAGLVCGDLHQMALRVNEICSNPNAIVELRHAVKVGYDSYYQTTKKKIEQAIEMWFDKKRL